jgi:hypothetical protein
MKKVSFLSCLWLVLFGSLAHAQNITATLTPAISTCQANGSITISNVNGGTCTPYKYALISGPNVLQPPVYQDAPVLTGLQAGTYAVSIRDYFIIFSFYYSIFK